VLLVYQLFFAKSPAPPKPAVAPSQQTASVPEETRTKQAISKIVVKKALAPKDIRVETAQYLAIFSTKGGALKSFQLKGYQKDCTECADDIYPRIKKIFTGSNDQPKPKSKDPVEMVNVKEGMPYPLAVTFADSNIDIAPDSIYETTTTRLDIINAKEKQRLVFSQDFDNKIKVEKIFTFNPDNYTIGLEVKVHNLTDSPLTEIPRLSWQQYVDPKQEVESYGHTGPVVSVAKSIERQEVSKLDKEKMLGPNVLWGGFESKYFIASFIPENPSLTSAVLNHNADNMVTVSIKGQKEVIPGGQSSNFSYTLYLGPKDYESLKAHNLGLEKAVEFDSFIPGLKWLSIGLLLFIKFLYQYVGNYGVAIIILTILIKIIFWPLGNMSFKSMKEMQNIQPKINELKEKHKNDQAKLSQETMAMYKTHKVNPFGGCLPILIQIPVFFGLYNTLLYAIELRHSPFFWWIQDLSAKDPYYITPIIMGATQFIQQKMTPTMGDPMQAKLMLLMPVIFTFFFLNFPSGLVIYWLFNNILQIGQQYYMNKKLAR
jgi:YidC/Oxa1 family membrane protein insertase